MTCACGFANKKSVCVELPTSNGLSHTISMFNSLYAFVCVCKSALLARVCMLCCRAMVFACLCGDDGDECKKTAAVGHCRSTSVFV